MVPDHSVLLSEIKIFQDVNNNQRHVSDVPKRYKLKLIPNDFFESELRKVALQNLISRIETTRETQSQLDIIYSDLCNLILDEMNDKIPIFDTSNRTRKKYRITKPFWNDTLQTSWNSMCLKEKRFFQFKDSPNERKRFRQGFQTAQKNFDRLLRQCERKH